MKTEFLKTLWTLRFEKMRKNEESAAWNYQEILNQCLDYFDHGDEVIVLLTQLVREERKHEKIAERLIEICRKNHPEVTVVV